MASETSDHNSWSTSIGRSNLPSTGTFFLSSATTIMESEIKATSFSRVRAPPPPLIREKLGSNSSAPSIVKSRLSASEIDINGIPKDSASSLVDSLVGTPTTSIPSSEIIRPISMIVYLTVEPVPRPNFIPLRTKLQAVIPASLLSPSTSDMVSRRLRRA